MAGRKNTATKRGGAPATSKTDAGPARLRGKNGASIDEDAIAGEIAALDDLPFAALRSRFEQTTGAPPPKRIGRKLLMLALAYEMQRKACGVRTDHLTARLHAVKERSSKARRRRPSAPKRSLRSGGRLVREWRGRSYEVHVADDGCYLDGARYGSLSAVAAAITGVKRNGPAFFGLRSPRATP